MPMRLESLFMLLYLLLFTSCYRGDYVKTPCTDSRCKHCSNNLPSCTELEDGFHPFPGREWTKFYISCHNGNLIEKQVCGKHALTRTEAVFSPFKKKCVSRFEIPRKMAIGLAPSCQGKKFGMYRTAERRDVYYSCPGEDVFYCALGTVFSEESNLCQTPGSI